MIENNVILVNKVSKAAKIVKHLSNEIFIEGEQHIAELTRLNKENELLRKMLKIQSELTNKNIDLQMKEEESKIVEKSENSSEDKALAPVIYDSPNPFNNTRKANIFKKKLGRIRSVKGPDVELIKMVAMQNNKVTKRTRASSFYFSAATPAPTNNAGNSFDEFDFNKDSLSSQAMTPKVIISAEISKAFSFQDIPDMKNKSKELQPSTDPQL